MVRKIVPILRNTGDDGHCIKAMQGESNEAGGIGLKSKLHHVDHQTHARGNFKIIGDINGKLGIHFWLGLFRPLLRFDHAVFNFAHCGKIFIKFFAILFTQPLLEPLCFLQNSIHDTFALLKLLNLCFNFGRGAIDKHFAENSRCPRFRRNGNTTASVRKPSARMG